MLDIRNLVFWLIGIIVLGVVLFLVRGHLSAEERARRRRKRSNKSVISRKPGPNIKLVVNVGKPKGDRKR